MNDLSAQIDVATVAMAQRQEKLQGQQALKLIQGAGAQQLASSPPSEPVSVTPRAGSTIEVIA